MHPPMPTMIPPPFVAGLNETIFSGISRLGPEGKVAQLHLFRGREHLLLQFIKQHRFPQERLDESWWEKEMREHKEDCVAEEFGVGALQKLLPQLPFGRTNRAFMVQKDGAWSILERPMHIQPLPGRDWGLPIVDERDIQLTRWLTVDRSEGLWRGRPVDVWRPPPEFYTAVERYMHHYTAIAHLDICFKVLAMISRQGAVVGIMTEAVIGRTLCYGDRGATYTLIAKLQKHTTCVYRGVSLQGIVVGEAGVRLLHPNFLDFYSPCDENSAALLEREHWGRLQTLFDQLRDSDPKLPPVQDPIMYRTMHGAGCYIIAWLPGPERPVSYWMSLYPEWLSLFFALLDQAQFDALHTKPGKKSAAPIRRVVQQAGPAGAKKHSKSLARPSCRSAMHSAEDRTGDNLSFEYGDRTMLSTALEKGTRRKPRPPSATLNVFAYPFEEDSKSGSDSGNSATVDQTDVHRYA